MCRNTPPPHVPSIVQVTKVGDIGGTKLQRYGPLGATRNRLSYSSRSSSTQQWARPKKAHKKSQTCSSKPRSSVHGFLARSPWSAFNVTFTHVPKSHIPDNSCSACWSLAQLLIVVAGMTVDSTLRAALSIQADNMSPEAMKTMHHEYDAFFWPMHCRYGNSRISSSAW